LTETLSPPITNWHGGGLYLANSAETHKHLISATGWISTEECAATEYAAILTGNTII